jgi:hypothetical protein
VLPFERESPYMEPLARTFLTPIFDNAAYVQALLIGINENEIFLAGCSAASEHCVKSIVFEVACLVDFGSTT